MLLNDDFLLTTDWAKKLYHDHAEHMPIIDYHCPPLPEGDLGERELRQPRRDLDLQGRRR